MLIMDVIEVYFTLYFTHYALWRGKLKPIWHFSNGVVKHVTSCDTGRGQKVHKKCDIIIEWPMAHSTPLA